jgi:amino acid adenylation domain-containing protein
MGFLLQHMLRDAATLRPAAPAVIFEDQVVSYAELERYSDGIAQVLQEQGVGRGDRVAIYMDKSPGAILAIHGILKAGAVYVPLDPHAPVQRLAYILTNCGVRCIVTATGKAASIAAIATEGTCLEVAIFTDDGKPSAVPANVRCVPSQVWKDRVDEGSPEIGSVETDLAYVLYTSGSTGKPKGVMISHRNAVGFVDWAADKFSVTHTDRLSSHAPLHFDLSIFDIFVAMKCGAAVVLVPDGTSTFPVRLVEWIQRNAITIWYSVPSILILLLLKGRLDRADLRSLRQVIFAGEVFPTKYLRELMHALPGTGFVNLYGPTETNVITWYEVAPLLEGQEEPIPIGWTCANTDIFLVDDTGARVTGTGVQGELYARGVTVAQGYWGDPEKTAKGFVQNPFESNFVDRVYRTGDIVVLGEDGSYRLIGRRDRMIKSRGYRIELDEIEVVLYAHPLVKEAAVVAMPDEMMGNCIKAFVSCEGSAELDSPTLRDYCLQKLPRYMVPESFSFLDVLPKTSTGKVDRTQLGRD